MSPNTAKKRVLVCGGRNYTDKKAVEEALGQLRNELGEFIVVEGGARGADRLASDWADSVGFSKETYPANWLKHGRSAGPIRNKEMLDTNPDLVVTFPGGAGTGHMVRIARAEGFDVWEPKGSNPRELF